MSKKHSLLVINVGSTSTKAAFFKETIAIIQDTITYGSKELAQYGSLKDQLPLREKDVLGFTEKNDINLHEIDMIISRGGLGRPAAAGAYAINRSMCRDLMEGTYGSHPSALGPAIALSIAEKYGMEAIVVDPPSTDEFQPVARISGLPGIERKSAFHALNQKAAARRAALELGKDYEDLNLIVAHLGGGITIGAHRHGRVVDCTHGLSEGPFTPERAGSLPTFEIINLAFSEKYSKRDILSCLVGRGGTSAYLGTTDAEEIEDRITGGDEEALRIYQAMAYQISKDIGAMSAVLHGRVDGIILTGGLAFSDMLTGWIGESTGFIAPIFMYPGEDEMTALAEGGLRVLRGIDTALQY